MSKQLKYVRADYYVARYNDSANKYEPVSNLGVCYFPVVIYDDVNEYNDFSVTGRGTGASSAYFSRDAVKTNVFNFTGRYPLDISTFPSVFITNTQYTNMVAKISEMMPNPYLQPGGYPFNTYFPGGGYAICLATGEYWAAVASQLSDSGYPFQGVSGAIVKIDEAFNWEGVTGNPYFAGTIIHNNVVSSVRVRYDIVALLQENGVFTSSNILEVDMFTSGSTEYWRVSQGEGPTQPYLNYFFDNAIIKDDPSAPDPQPDDPFAGGGTSEPGGGGGTFDADSDQIPDSSLPSLSVADTGFARVYNPTLSQLKSLAEYMWTSDSFLETLLNHAKQLIEDPMNAIISLNLLPCPIPNGSPVDVKVLYINTGVQMSPATTQFVDVDCGSVELNRYYGSALDYSPYTKASLFLPYIGQVTLDVDEIMNRTVNVKYRIDIVSGMCVAKVLVDGNVMYQFSGHCAINMPLNSADFSGYIGALVQAAKVGTTVVAGAAGGASAAAAVAGLSPGRSSTSTTTTTVRNPVTGRQITAGTERQSRSTAPASWGEIANKTISNSVSAVMGSKTIVEHAGSFSGNSGYLGVRRPYLIIERPRMCNPAEYGQLNGYPSLLTLEFSSLKGYTEVQEVQLTGLSATNPELSELSLLLKGGVIF